MKKTSKISLSLLTLLFGLMTFAQSFPPIDNKIIYAKHDFKKVEKLLEDGLPNKAIEELLAIQEKSIQENNLFNFNQSLTRIIASLYYSGMEPKEVQNLFYKHHELLVKVKGPIQNILALNLDNWYQNIRYRNIFSFDDESLNWTIKGKKTQLKNYDPSPLIQEYQTYFLKNEVDLMQIASDQIFDSTELKYKPTLYDVLAERSLSSDSYDEMNDSCHWESTIDFTQESLSKNNLIFANLEQLHQTNQRWDTYAYWLERRLNNCDNDQLTKENLLPVYEKFQKELIGFPASNRFAYRRAQIFAEKASQYDWRIKNTDEFGFQVALIIIEEAFSVHPKSEFDKDLKALKEQIMAPSLDLVFDNDIRPSSHNFINVKFRNLPSAEMIIYKIESRFDENIYTENILKNLELKDLGMYHLKLYEDPKHLNHDKDFLLEELSEPGKYLIIAAATLQDCEKALKVDVLQQVENVTFEILYLTNLVLRKSNESDGVRILVNSIETGKPVKKAKVIVDQTQGTNKTVAQKEYKTDKNGSVKLEGNRRSKVTVYQKQDSITDYIYFYTNNQNNPVQRRVFTDRSIYRPGQSVFYKTLSYSENANGYETSSGITTKIFFKDVNNQILYERAENANEYGSTSGSFVLPKKGLPLGNIQIYMDDVYAESIQVEEYKRPTFTVSYDQPKEKIALGTPVKMEGKVSAFAGYPITNAEVEVNISEIRYFPRWCIVLEEDRIHDTTIVVKTDDKGIFKIEFTPQNPKETYGVFYSFEALVVDLTGETQSAYYSMFIGKSALSISANVKAKYKVDELGTLICKVENSQGIKQEGVSVKCEILKKENENWFRKTRNEAEFKDFSEKELKDWKPELAYYKGDILQKHTSLLNVDILSGAELNLQSILDGKVGDFEIRFSINDGSGDSASLIKSFVVWNPESKKDQHQEEFWMEVLNPSPILGDEVEICIGTSHKKAKLLLATYNDKGLISANYKKIKKRRNIKIDMDESLKNGVALYASIIKKGVVSERNTQIFPIDSSRILNMKLKSIQEPLRPGSEQTWVMEVTQKGNKVNNCEMLTGMYDASLDDILGHSWQHDLIPRKYINAYWNRTYNRSQLQQGTTWPSVYFYLEKIYSYRGDYGMYDAQPMISRQKAVPGGMPSPEIAMDAVSNGKVLEDEIAAESSVEKDGGKSVNIRENFNETAFFLPQIHANEKGDYQWTFTLPDALTKWRMMSMVHTKDVKYAYFTQSFEARKELMLETFEPRFWRKGDSLVWVGKVTNLTEKEQIVDVKLKFTNPMTEEDISAEFGNFVSQKITLAPNESKAVEWDMFVPESAPLVVNFEAEASNEDFADVVRKPTPVLNGSETVTMAENFTFDEKGIHEMKLGDIEKISNEAKLISYSVQVQPQPLWSTILSLAVLMEPKNELTESYFTQYFSTQLAIKILQENPEMKRALKTWQLADEDAMTSLLEQNEELKSLVLSETVWFADAKNESQNLRRLGQLLDDDNLKRVSNESWAKLKKLQLADGTWSWIGQERCSWYITQYIVNGLAWLKESNIKVDETTFSQTVNALDNHYRQQYAKLTKLEREKEYGLNTSVIQWLYIRSFLPSKEDSATIYYSSLIPKQWKNYSLSTEAIIGLWALRKNDKDFADKLKASLNDRARRDKKLGMYWNENLCGYGWFENNIETHAMLTQFLEKAGQAKKDVQAMQMWLLQQKRTQMWDTPKSTAMACYALQSSGNEGTKTQKVTLQIPNQESVIVPNEKVISTYKPNNQDWTNVRKTATIELTSDAPVFANAQITYSDKAENIQKTTGDFRVERIYYLVKNGEEIAISPKDEMQLGDVIRVKIKLVSDRNLDFVFIEDPKASGWEPMNALSGYQYGNNIYYLSNHDSKTEFFIENMNKGTHTYVYDLKITAKGVFQVGPSKAMCYYAPTFVANTQGKKFKVK
jgi:hypothetical protein